MQNKRRFDISLRPLVKPAVITIAAMTLFGAIPTWLVYKWTGVAGEFIAVFGVVGVMFGSAKMVTIAANGGVKEACLTFLAASVIRAVACPAIVLLIAWVFRMNFEPMLIWLAICYISCLFMECLWIVAALKRHVKLKKETEKKQQTPQPNYMDWSI